MEQETIDESTALILECRTLKIQTADDYRYAAGKRGAIKELIKALTARAQPRIDEAKAHLDNLRKDLQRDIGPLAVAYEQVGSLLVTYDTEQDRIRRKAQLEAEAKARQEALDEKKRMAELAKQVGDKELVKEIKAAPLVVEPVVVVKETPKVEGLSYATYWHYEVEDMKALVRAVVAGKVPVQAITFDAGFLRKQVNALHDSLNYEGVKVWSTRGPRQG